MGTSAMGALAVLMGGTEIVQAGPSKPEGQDYDSSVVCMPEPQTTIAIDTLMKVMGEYSAVQTDHDLSDCIHIIDKDRMADMDGYTIMIPKDDKHTPLGVRTRTTA